MKRILKISFLLFLLIFSCSLWIPKLRYLSEISRLDADAVESPRFRQQPVNVQTARIINDMENPGEYLAVYWLESGFGEQNILLTPEDCPDSTKTLGKSRRLEQLSECLSGSVGRSGLLSRRIIAEQQYRCILRRFLDV